jgi:hypothetical protein
MKYGWKFLDGSCSTTHEGIITSYPVPAPGEKWGPWMEHPRPAKPDGQDCGPDRYHIMKRPSATYAPVGWWIWYARYEDQDIIGESDEKTGVKRVSLRRVTRKSFMRMIRLGWMCDANLCHANLRYADLRRADLCHANLCDANLRDADLRGADLRGADLRDADLRDADLRDADLRDADLRDADLRDADLRDAIYTKYTLWSHDPPTEAILIT